MSEFAGKPLDGRVVLIVGATGGLGEAASVAAARAGATVVLLGRNVRRLNKVYDAVTAAGGEAMLYPMDLEGASPDDYLELAERLKETFGRLDGLLHVAAEFRGLTPLEYTDPAQIARAMHINVTAPIWLTSAVLPVMKLSDDASVVFVVDDVDHVGKAHWGPYAAAQQARAALVPMWAKETEGSSVRIAGLQPGPMRTALRAKATVEDIDSRLRDPETYAADCVRLLSAAGRGAHGHIERVLAPEPTPTRVALSVLSS